MANLSKYGVARHIYRAHRKAGSNNHAVSADWTPAAGDVKISKDGGAAANVTNLPVAIAMGNSTIWDYSITATEMQAAQILVTVGDSVTKAVEDDGFEIETYGNASAQHAVDLSDGVRAGLTALPNAVAAAANGLITFGTGTGQLNVSGGRGDSDVRAIDTDTTVDTTLKNWLLADISGTSDSGTTTTMVDAARTEADTDYWKGSILLFTSGNLAGQARRITAFNAATDTITVSPAFTQACATQNYTILPDAGTDVIMWNGTAVSVPATAGIPEVNVKNINNVAAATPGASGGLVIVGTNSAAISFTAGVTFSNAGGDAFVCTSSGSNGKGIKVTGNGTGAGVDVTGGATGTGLNIAAGGGNAPGTQSNGAGTGAGMLLSGTASGPGLKAQGSTNAPAMDLLGAGASPGLRTTGGTTGAGASFIGGATSGDAISTSVTSGVDTVKSNLTAINGSAPSGANIARSTQAIVLGTVGSASSTTSIVTSSLDPAAAVTDQFKRRVVTFDRATTTANLRGQSTDITASTAGGVLTVSTMTTAPVSGDTFTIT